MATTLLIGLGRGGSALLPYLLAKDDFDVVAACDSNPQAVGVTIARQCGLEVYEDAVEALTDLHIDLVIDATGDNSLATLLYQTRPPETSLITGEASRLLWELLSTHEAQRRSEIRYNRLLEDMHSGLVVVQDSTIKFANHTFYDMLGYSEKTLRGCSYGKILADDTRDRDLDYHRQRVHGEKPQREYDTRIIDAQGNTREMRVRARLTEWNGKPASLAIMYDVTELRQLQREREQFFRYMVHELRAPLSPLVSVTALLRKPEVQQDQERMQKLTGILARSTDRLQSFVDDYLELSKIQEQTITLKQKELDLAAIIEEVTENQRILAEDKGLELNVQQWEQFSVYGDDFVVRTAVRNLVNNAVKYTQEGRVTVSVDHDAKRFRIHVADTGVGLSEEEQRRIFQEFGRIQRTEGMKGSGLGLALVKKLVETSNGEVQVESAGQNRGSTFTVELPREFGTPEKT